MTITCPGCGLTHPDLGLPGVPDRRASGECAREAGDVHAPFYSPELYELRQYVVDAYACLHPDGSSRRGIQSTALCLMTMDLYLEAGQPVSQGAAMHQEMATARTDPFALLEPPDLRDALTHRHLAGASTEQLPHLAEEWARSVWEAWSPHHDQVRAWNRELVPHRLRSENS